MYSQDLLRDISRAAETLVGVAETRFLGLNMLRAAHQALPQVQELVRSPERLGYLSEVAGVELEPYPIDVARSHINYYRAYEAPIDLHSDGSAIVELIPLDEIPDSGATLIYKGPRDQGYAKLKESPLDLDSDTCFLRVPHIFGQSTLFQGRRLLHGGSSACVDRKMLVIAMRSKVEPWKDDNSIARLAMDYDPHDFLDQWVQDELSNKLPAYRRAANAKRMVEVRRGLG